jgi:hypothetical protein
VPPGRPAALRGPHDEATSLPSRSEFAAARASTFQPSRDAAHEDGTAKPKRKKRKKKSSLGLSTNELLGTAGAIAGVIVGVIVLVYLLPESRFPIGAFVAVVGGIVTLVGAAGLWAVAREAGPIQYLLCRFVPFYAVLFILTHWEETREHLGVYCVGVTLLGCGVGVLVSAERHKHKAVDVERAVHVPGTIYAPLAWKMRPDALVRTCA